MKIKSLMLGIVVAASLGSTAEATNLVLNGSFDKPGDTSTVNFFCNSPFFCGNAYPAAGYIPKWDVHGATGSTTYNVVYIYDNLADASLPPFMPPSYYCNPALGFVSGNNCVNPDGTGHFINLDGDPSFQGAISQSINGLVQGQQYKLSFSWGAVQRDNETGAITDNYLDVSLGDQHFFTQNIPPSLVGVNLPEQGFSGWFTTSHIFTWNGTGGNVLNFLAHGKPGGHPPSINLDGISLTAVPEPTTWALLIAGGFGLLGVGARRRRQTAVAD
jgi:hypothetical protein